MAGRRVIAAAAALIVVAAGCAEPRKPVAGLPMPSPVPSSTPWTGTWAVAVQGSGEAYERQTLRQIVHTSIGGSTLRVRLTNEFGTQPLTVGSVRVARHAEESAVVPGTDRPVTFAGSSSVTVPAGKAVTSDGVAFAVPADADLAVSMYLPAPSGAATFHTVSSRTNYVGAGDQSAAERISDLRTIGTYAFLTGVDVQNPQAAGAVVALGASVTDGVGSTPDTNRRWPDVLSRRLHAAGRTVAVLNAGISGNELLRDAAGQSVLNRFDRDVLARPGVRWVIFSDAPGNDLGRPDRPSGAELIAGIRSLVRRSHEAGLRIVCSTLTPAEGARYWSPAGERGRQEVNAFVRGPDSGCDAVIDQDAATRDPASPTRLREGYDVGDHLHPNDAGLAAIAEAIDLSVFVR